MNPKYTISYVLDICKGFKNRFFPEQQDVYVRAGKGCAWTHTINWLFETENLGNLTPIFERFINANNAKKEECTPPAEDSSAQCGQYECPLNRHRLEYGANGAR